MPSKPRKQAKTPLKAPPSSETCDDDDGLLLQILEEASALYPSLIAKTAFIGAVAEVDNQSSGSTVWLSETSMVASSFAHGSLVSVSLPSLSSKYSDSSPLSSVSDEFASHVGSNLLYRFTDEAGNYFALAKLCCSSKVVKDGVRLSSSLSRTMGDPTVGKPVFICPIKDEISPSNPCLVSNCSELYLDLIHCQRLSTINNSSKIASKTSFSFGNGVSGSSSPKTPMNQMKASSSVTSQSQLFSSPKTPMNQIKASSSVTSQLTSSVCNNSYEELTDSNDLSTVSFNITELLGEEGVAKRLIDTWATPWLYSRCLLRGNLVTIPILSQLCTFQVVGAKKLDYNSSMGSGNDLIEAFESSTRSIDAFVVQRETQVCLGLPSRLELKSPEGQSSFNLESEFQIDSEDDYEKLGGLSAEYGILKNIILSSSKNTLSSYGLRTTKGVLLRGPPGTGKTSLAQSCIRDAKVNLFSVYGPELVTQKYGETEQALHELFESAQRAAPAVIFFDEFDAIAQARKDGGEELSQRMVATLLDLMDGIGRSEGILVIATTNRPDSIDPALRRPGRLDKEIEIGVPSPKQRLDILQSLLRDKEHSLLDTQVQNLAISTHGFVGGDLAALCNEAASICFQRHANLRKQSPFNDSYAISRPDHSEGRREILIDCLDSATSEESALKVTFDDFEKAKMKVRPSAMREVILEVPKVRWEDVGGQREVKSQLIEAVEWPQKHRDAFNRIGTRPPTGVLLYGPPGCSKTLLARAVASEAGLNFLAVKGPELFRKWVGESEKAVRSVFAKARANSPSVIFFDELDSLASIRGKENDGVSVSDRVISQLLVEMDGLHQRLDVTVIAATNRPDKIDSALLRPGRFDRLLYVGPPNGKDREEIFRIHLRKIPCSADVSIADLSSLTEGFTGADISCVCREAGVKAMEEDFDASEITMRHLKASIEEKQPSPTQSYREYRELTERFQRLVVAKNT